MAKQITTTRKGTVNIGSHPLFQGNLLTAAIIAVAFLWSPDVRAVETNATPERIGVYDSRAVAYAHFWTEAHQREINEKARAAKDAKAAGETARYEELSAALKKEQERIHVQVFSTAPVDDVLTTMKERLALIRKEARVSRFVSKWDKTLKDHNRAEQVEVTDLMLREFKLNEKQTRVLEDIRKQQPLPLDKTKI